MPSPLISSRMASVLLDALRGIAALLVLLQHWRNAFFVDFPQINHYRKLFGLFYIISGAGHQAVIIFFVLSGYLISGTILRAVQSSQWSWPQYLMHRLVRLWLVLIPALLLGAAWDMLGLHMHQASTLYAGTRANHMTPNVTDALTPGTFLGNAAFLQTILVPALGSNGPLWSLANEWWYYILFPLAACVLGRVYGKPVQALACGVSFFLITCFLTKAILLLFPVWLLGAALYAAPRPRVRFNARTLLAAGLVYAVALFSLAAFERYLYAIANDYILALLTFAFIWMLISASGTEKDTALVRLARGTARFSYTLYVVHMPILIFLASLLVHNSRWTPSFKHLLLSLVVLSLVVTYAWLIASVTEFRTDQVRRWIESRLLGKKRESRAFAAAQ